MASIAGQQSAKTHKDSFTPASKFLELVEYDAANDAMDVTFKTGAVRRYLSVSRSAFASFKESSTHDAFYARVIKGKIASVPIRMHNIGTNKSKPLDKKHDRRTLDAGLKRIEREDRYAPGTRPADFIRR